MAISGKTSYAPSLSDEEIMASLRARVRSRMDGATAAAMRSVGVDYAYNLGLSIPQLRELACELPSRQSLAEKLLSAQLREMRILGLMTYPSDNLNKEKATLLAQTLETEELRNLYAFHLLAQVPSLAEWFPDQTSLYIQRTWLVAITRRLLLKLSISGLEAPTTTTLQRLTSQPETLSTTELNWLERMSNDAEGQMLLYPTLQSWLSMPEKHPLHSVADYILHP